jgi:hypothetical protein
MLRHHTTLTKDPSLEQGDQDAEYGPLLVAPSALLCTFLDGRGRSAGCTAAAAPSAMLPTGSESTVTVSFSASCSRRQQWCGSRRVKHSDIPTRAIACPRPLCPRPLCPHSFSPYVHAASQSCQGARQHKFSEEGPLQSKYCAICTKMLVCQRRPAGPAIPPSLAPLPPSWQLVAVLTASLPGPVWLQPTAAMPRLWHGSAPRLRNCGACVLGPLGQRGIAGRCQSPTCHAIVRLRDRRKRCSRRAPSPSQHLMTCLAALCSRTLQRGAHGPRLH